MSTKRGLAICAVVLTATFGAVGHADEITARDTNDVAGPLDIAMIAHSHASGDQRVQRVTHRVRLFERWPVRRLRHQGYINLFFDLPGNSGWREERAVYVAYDRGRLRAQMINFGVDPPEPMRYVRLRRPTPRSITVSFDQTLLRAELARYSWYAVSFIEGRHQLCGEHRGCRDVTPHLRHNL